MLLAIDVGNTSTKLALFDGESLVRKSTSPTIRNATVADLQRQLASIDADVSGAIASSVVPEIDATLGEAIKSAFGVELRMIQTSDGFGLTFLGPVDHAGTDRLVNSFAAAELYGVPAIVISFGTATVIEGIDRDRRHLGGLIAPGMRTSAKALELATSKLPDIEMAKPENIVGYETVDAIRSGIFNSQVGLVEHCVAKLKQLIGDDAQVIATGGFASMIAEECDCIDTVDSDLTVNGLRLLSERI